MLVMCASVVVAVMPLAVRVRMFMIMAMDVIMLAVVQALAWPRTARIFAEHQ